MSFCTDSNVSKVSFPGKVGGGTRPSLARNKGRSLASHKTLKFHRILMGFDADFVLKNEVFHQI